MNTIENSAPVFYDEMNVSILNYRFRFKINPENEVLSNLMRMKGVYSHHDIFLYEKLLTSGSSFIDIGANLGWYTLFASKMVGHNGHVYAFEPETNNMNLLKHNISTNGLQNVTTFDTALSDIEDTAQLYLSNTNFGDYSLGRPQAESFRTKDVQLKRLDTVMTLEDFKKVRLIKIDVQGAEPQVLNGAKALLQEHTPFMIIEFSPLHLYQCGNSPFDIFSFIERYNYVPAILDDDKGPALEEMLTYIDTQQLMLKMQELKQSGQGIDLFLIPQSHPK